MSGITWDVEKACAGALDDILKLGLLHEANVELGVPPETALRKRIATPVEIMNFPLVVEKIKDIVKQVKQVTAHLAMIDIASLDEAVRRRNVAIQIEVMKIAYGLGIRRFVLHPVDGETKYPWFASRAKKEQIIRRRQQASAKSVHEIVDALNSYPIVIGIENMDIDDGNWAIKKLGYEFGQHGDLFLGICLDTLHELSTGCKTADQFAGTIDDCGNFLVEIHLNNGFGRKKRLGRTVAHRHQALTVGSVPVKELICKLLKDGFSRPVVVEVDSGGEVDISIEHIWRAPHLLFS
jgi:sugar phosphate isomerase/epimerase